MRTSETMDAVTGAVTIANRGRNALRRSITIISLLVAIAVLFTAMPAAARSKIALGVSTPEGSYKTVVEDHLARYGRYPAMFSLWSSWGARGQARAAGKRDCVDGPGNGSCYFPRDAVDYLMERNITPIIWWQFTNPNLQSERLYSRYKLIVQGRHDKYIRQWARELKAASARHNNRRIGVRFAHEAAGPWFPWSIRKFDNSAANYKGAWRHLHKQFATVGARKNALFIWSQYFPRKGTYPGDRYIDYIGFTVLNFGRHQKRINGKWVWKNKWRTAASQVNPAVKAVKSFSKRPILLMEVASSHLGGNKSRWLRQGYLKAYRQHPRIRGILYLDTSVPSNVRGQRHPDWRLVIGANVWQTYKRLGDMRMFQGVLR